MIKLQVNHDKHNPLRTVLIKKEHSQATQHTDENNTESLNENVIVPLQHPTASQQFGIDKQSKVIGSIQATTLKVKKDLEQLINEYKCQAQKIMTNHGYDPQKEASIKQHLRKLQQEKRQRRIRFDRDLARLQEKKQALQKQCGDGSQVQMRRKSIEQRIHKIKQREKRRREDESQFMKFYQEYKQAKPRYKKMEQEFNKKEQREKLEKLSAVKHKIEETYHPMNLQELSQFEEEYLHRKREAEKMRLRNHLQQRKKEEMNMARLSDLYKGHCHSNIRRELEERQSKTNESYEKYRRIKEYSELVKQEYKPKTRMEEQIQDQDECPQSQRGKRVIKERYVHGQYLGKKVEYEKVPLSHSQHINKGIEYLQFLKKLPKKPKPQKKETETSVMTQRKRTISSVYKVERELNPLYRGKKYNSIDFTSLDDRDSVNRMMEVMRHKNRQLQLDELLVKNGRYQDRSSFMSAQKSYNNKMVQNIESKLQMLKKI